MSNTLGGLPISQIEEIVSAVWEEFAGRRKKWGDRRKIRFRQMDRELGSLPLSTRAGGNKALMIYQTEEPNQEVHRRVKRLIANKERIEVITYAHDQDTKDEVQEVKDALKAIWKWMNRGKVSPNRLATTYQQGDGCGILKLDLVADYADEALATYDPDVLEDEANENEPADQKSARESYQTLKRKYQSADENDLLAPEKAYHDVVHKALRKCDPPFRLSAPDPLTIAYTVDGDSIDVVVEKGKRNISALLSALGPYNVRMVENRLVVFPDGNSDALAGATIPDNMKLDKKYNDQSDYTEIRTKNEICIIINQPTLRKATDSSVPKEGGKIKITFENPFGPYSTGYVLVPGDITGSLNPADDFQPSILGTLNLAGKINVLTTIRVSAAIDAALAPPYIETKPDDASPPPQLSVNTTTKTKGVKDGEPIPIIPGKLQRMASANIDLDKAEQRFMAEESLYRFNEVLSGDAQSSDSGHKLAIQVSQADTQLVPYQNTRAEAVAEVLMCILYAGKKLGKPIYIKEIPDMQAMAMNKAENTASIRVLTPEMFDLMQDAMLVVTIGSETPVTKFAKWSALQQRYERGTLSFETLMEQSDVENVADEVARIFEGQTLVAVMQQAVPVVVKMIAQRAVQKIQGPPQEPAMQGGNENGGGMPGAQESLPINGGIGRLPGVGISPAGPPEQTLGGNVQPGGAELGAVGT